PPQPLAYDTTLTITGVSYTEGQVSDYIDALNRSGYFRAVDLRWVRKGSNLDKNDETMRTFSLALNIDPDADASASAGFRNGLLGTKASTGAASASGRCVGQAAPARSRGPQPLPACRGNSHEVRSTRDHLREPD